MEQEVHRTSITEAAKYTFMEDMTATATEMLEHCFQHKQIERKQQSWNTDLKQEISRPKVTKLFNI